MRDSLNRLLYELVGVHLKLVASTLADLLPKLLECGVVSHVLLELDLDLLALVLDYEL